MHESIKPAFKRLFDAQAHWHDAAAKYFDPHAFRISINSCIQELRNVTFVLQSNKRGIDGFDEWYEPWQTRMRANDSLRWLVSARNHIVKQGDLELNSILRIEVIGSYLAGEVPIFEQNYNPNLSNQDIFQKTLECGLPKEVFENSYVKLDRRWVDTNNPGYELLELLGLCWTSVMELLLDAPNSSNDEKQQIKAARIPPCMYQGSETRSIWMKVEGDDLIPTVMHEEQLDLEKSDIDGIKNRYEDSPLFQQHHVPSNFKEQCELFFEQAKYMLKKDGYHVHLVAIFVDSKLAELRELRNEDQSDKYRTIRLVASEIEKIGANQFLMISEAWTAPFDPKFPNRHASQSPDRKEVLNLVGASKSGEGYSFTIPFVRKNDEIIYGKQHVGGVKGLNIIQPILAVWKN